MSFLKEFQKKYFRRRLGNIYRLKTKKDLFISASKGIIILILFILNNKVYSTPTIEDGLFDKEYYEKYIMVGELIYEVNNVDTVSYTHLTLPTIE